MKISDIVINVIYISIISAIWITISIIIHRKFILSQNKMLKNRSKLINLLKTIHYLFGIATFIPVIIYLPRYFITLTQSNYKVLLLIQLPIWLIAFIISRSQIEYGKWFTFLLIYDENKFKPNHVIENKIEKDTITKP